MIYFIVFIASVFGDSGKFEYLKLSLFIEQMIWEILKGPTVLRTALRRS